METKTKIELYANKAFYFSFLNYIEEHHNRDYELEDIKSLHLGSSTATISFKDGFELNLPLKEVFNGNY